MAATSETGCLGLKEGISCRSGPQLLDVSIVSIVSISCISSSASNPSIVSMPWSMPSIASSTRRSSAPFVPPDSAVSDGRVTSPRSTASAYARTWLADGRIFGSGRVIARNSTRTSASTTSPASSTPEMSALGLPTQRGNFLPVAH